MDRFRRALFAVIASVTLIYGFGFFTAAMACPSTLPQASAANGTSDDCCDRETPECVLASCGSFICQAIPSVRTESSPPLAAQPSYWSELAMLDPLHLEPEPPPPRLG